MRDHIAKVRDVLINKDEQSPETIRTATSELQQASLKLFEMAYKKVCELALMVNISVEMTSGPFLYSNSHSQFCDIASPILFPQGYGAVMCYYR